MPDANQSIEDARVESTMHGGHKRVWHAERLETMSQALHVQETLNVLLLLRANEESPHVLALLCGN
jgi:hypothetical protein